MMGMSEYIDLEDPRVVKKITRQGKIYTTEGLLEQPGGLHVEPRMTSVMVGAKSWFMNRSDYVELEVEDTPLLGIVYELAEHHYDLDLYIDDEDVYKGFSCLSAYMPSSDGLGKVQWLMLSQGKHKVRIEVSSRCNRMLALSGVEPTHACLSGFIMSRDLVFPPPLYGFWMFSQQPLPAKKAHTSGYLREATLPPNGYLYLMDLFGHGTLESLSFHVDHAVVLEAMDGGAAEASLYPHDFPSWVRRLRIPADSDASRKDILSDIVRLVRSDVDSGLSVVMNRGLRFASRLIVRIHNPTDEECRLSRLYMEGTIKLM
jgi:hypothetical protein